MYLAMETGDWVKWFYDWNLIIVADKNPRLPSTVQNKNSLKWIKQNNFLVKEGENA